MKSGIIVLFVSTALLTISGCSLPYINFIVINRTGKNIRIEFKYDAAFEQKCVFHFDSFSPNECYYELNWRKQMKPINCDYTIQNWEIDTMEQAFKVVVEDGKYATIGSTRQPYISDPADINHEKFNIEKLKITTSDSSSIEANYVMAEKLFKKFDKLTYGIVVE
jgi:NADPH:quinone reductase-like Zn-dependent oxidoreductase